jgi:hypothetical protein
MNWAEEHSKYNAAKVIGKRPLCFQSEQTNKAQTQIKKIFDILGRILVRIWFYTTNNKTISQNTSKFSVG